MPLEEFIIAVFCGRESILQEIMTEYPLRQRGFSPKLSDSEVLTMEIVGEFLGRDMEKHIWQYFLRHWSPWFPQLGWSCTCTIRINIPGSPIDCHKSKKA